MNVAGPSNSTSALGSVARHPDVALAVGVAGIIAMLILPLPSLMVDGLLATNLALAAVILVAVLLSQRPLAISTFPTLLLITTLFRLALNVSTTRMILAQGTAGDVVKAFGEFVIRGDVIVGLVVFLVITLVQFLVIGKGAERVAEVGARFTLDAMPGKQMSIDAAVRSGSIDEAEGQAKRDELGRESQFYGAMDGAMKFVKGDAIAGLIITALNLIAGLIIGVMRNGMDLATAAETYTILTVGDGLVSQLPALLITLSAGVLTTRVAAKDQTTSLGANLQEELFSSPKVLAIGAGFALALGLVPGLPLLPFLLIASALAATSLVKFRNERRRIELRAHINSTFKEDLDKKVEQAKAQEAHVDNMAPAVTPLAIELDPELSTLLRAFQPQHYQLPKTFKGLRDSMFVTTGIRYPHIVTRANRQGLKPYEFTICIKDVPVFRGEVMPGMVMVLCPPEQVQRTGVDFVPTKHPNLMNTVAWVAEDKAEALRATGLEVWSIDNVIACHIGRELRKHAPSFLGLQDVAEMLERFERIYPTLVKEVVPKVFSIGQLADVLRRLASEQVSVRDLKTILECLADTADIEHDRVKLTEHVRAALRYQIAYQHAGLDDHLKVILLDELIQDTIASGIEHCGSGSYLDLPPDQYKGIIQGIIRVMQAVSEQRVQPIILTSPGIRRYVHQMLSAHLPHIPVLSSGELPDNLNMSPLGMATMPEELAA